MTRAGVIDLLRTECENTASVRAWALANDITPTYVSNVVRGGQTPGPKILAALGLGIRKTTRVTYYRLPMKG